MRERDDRMRKEKKGKRNEKIGRVREEGEKEIRRQSDREEAR